MSSTTSLQKPMYIIFDMTLSLRVNNLIRDTNKYRLGLERIMVYSNYKMIFDGLIIIPGNYKMCDGWST